jgi:hypothetical protein
MSSPDYIEPFLGWKGLLASADGRLFSPQWRDEWPAGEAFVATCANKKHKPPVASCGCGIYAVDAFEALRAHDYHWEKEGDDEALGHYVWVIAEINLWGEVRKGQIGFRASKAYPKKVYVPAIKHTLGLAVKERYGCQLGYINRFTGERI